MKTLYSLAALSLIATSLLSAPIAKKDGFSGFVSAGISSLDFKSNTVAGNFFDETISDETINNIQDEADSVSTTQPNLNYNLVYTFADIKTEVSLGTSLEDVLTFDATTTLGVRKDFGNIGILGVSALSSTLPAYVWKDPYQTGTSRDSTEQTSQGIALKWEEIMRSNFDIELRSRKIDIDGGDQSGLHRPYVGSADTTALTASQLNDKLDREGDLTSAIGSYRWKIDKDDQLKTSIRYSNYDLNGDSMQHVLTALELNYLHVVGDWSFIVNGSVGQDDYDNANPLFNDQADASVYGGSLTAMVKNPFGWSKDISLIGTLAGAQSDSDINFYDSSINILSASVLFKF